MVTSSLRIALALVGCLTVVGCAAEPAGTKETPLDENTIGAPKSTHNEADDEGDTATLPITPVTDDNAVPTTEDRSPPGQGGDPATTTPKPPTPGTTPPAAEKTQTCTATNGDYKSVTTVKYTVTSDSAKVTKMTVLVTNQDLRDENDVDVFTQASGGAETKAFNSGDILVHDQSIPVPDATKLSFKTGTKLRIETNFDRKLRTDPSADCTIQF